MGPLWGAGSAEKCVWGGSPSTTGFSRNFRADWRGARPLSWDSRLSADPTMAPKGRSEVSRRVACWPERAHSPDAHPVRQQKRGRPCRLARPQPSAVTFQRLTQAAGRGARRRRWRPSRPGGGTRKLPPRLEPPCNRRRPEPSRGPQQPTRHGGRGRRRGLCCGAEDHGR